MPTVNTMLAILFLVSTAASLPTCDVCGPYTLQEDMDPSAITNLTEYMQMPVCDVTFVYYQAQATEPYMVVYAPDDLAKMKEDVLAVMTRDLRCYGMSPEWCYSISSSCQPDDARCSDLWIVSVVFALLCVTFACDLSHSMTKLPTLMATRGDTAMDG